MTQCRLKAAHVRYDATEGCGRRQYEMLQEPSQHAQFYQGPVDIEDGNTVRIFYGEKDASERVVEVEECRRRETSERA